MSAGHEREQRPQPTHPRTPSRSGWYENLCITRCRQRSLCFVRGLWPDACNVNSERPHESQQRCRTPP